MWKAVFFWGGGRKDQSWTEIGTDGEQEWMLLQEDVSDLQLFPLLVAPQNDQSNRSGEPFFCEARTPVYFGLFIAHKFCSQR